MSELKVYVPQDGIYGLEPEEGGLPVEEETCYLKSEADKVIRHHKYKRCLAMAKWCEATALWCYQAACTLPKGFKATLHGKPVMIEPARLFKRHELLTKWSGRWLELAEKFKEYK